MSDELKACPFCGGNKLKIDSKAQGYKRWNDRGNYKQNRVFSVRCQVCNARGGAYGVEVLSSDKANGMEIGKAKATELWNTRTSAEQEGKDGN